MNDPARTSEAGPAGETQAPARPALLERLLRRSAAALAVERIWRVGAALLALVLSFLALSWSGVWLEVSPLWRIIGVVGFILVGVYVLARDMLRGPPRRKEALARLDAGADPALRPAASLEDRLAGDTPDPATRALWTLHRRRLERALEATPVAAPAPRMAERDPFALRALALAAAVAMGFVAGDAKLARLRAAFDWNLMADGAGGTARLDAWLDPPPYTGRPPLVLEARDADAAQPTQAPVNSILHVRLPSGSVATTSGGLAELAGAREQTRPRDGLPPSEREQTFKLTGAARLVAPDGRGFDLAIIPDQPPKIALTEPGRINSRGSLTLAYRTEDDYGVVGAEAVVSRLGGPRTLVPPPKFPLTTPAGREGPGEARSTLDLSESPWAGARATLTLVARDEGGNKGLSQPIDLTLPQRSFTKPLARALVEQRRNLVLDPDGRAKVAVALEALSLAPEIFETPTSIHLGLREARRGLEGRRGDEDLLSVADMLWAMALSIEGGDLSQAERDLRAAQGNLSEALAKGAADEEIERLTQELRQAMDKFLQGLSEQAARNGDKRRAPQEGGNARTLSDDDIKSMLDEIAKAAKSGDSAEAQRLLDELRDMLENLQPSQGAANADQRDMSRVLSELDRLSREQQQLRDDTYQRTKPGEESRAKQGGASGERQRQLALRERLERQRDELRRSGEDAPGELNDADKAMQEAEDALKQNGAGRGRAVDAQGRALQALRRGADQLAERMKGAGEEGEEPGQGERQGRASGQGSGDDQDPLGRTAGRSRGLDRGSRYDPMGLPPALRARRVQEELRRRLGQPERPEEELDYLQRLLRR